MRTLFLLLILTLFGKSFASIEPPQIPDLPTSEKKNVDVFMDVLYWQPSQQVDWSFTITHGQNLQNIAYKTIEFPWKPGFRIGLGYNMSYDCWDTQCSYTWFRSTATAQTEGNITSAFMGSKLALFDSYETGQVRWQFSFNMLDWDLGRSFFVSDYLSFRPSVGLKGGWIDQKIQSNLENPLVLGFRTIFTARDNTWHNYGGGGPKGGFAGKWVLACTKCNTFTLLGNFSTAYMWGHWHVRNRLRGPITSVAIVTSRRNSGSIMLHSFIGLGWDTYFDQNRSRFGLKLGYEIQDFLNQYQGFDNATGAHNNDLILQGLTANARLDF